MAVATGTALLIGAAVSAAGAAAAAKKGADANREATAAGLTSSQKAIAEQRRNQELERRRLATMWEAWNQRRGQLMARYGLDVPQNPSNPFVANMPESYGGQVPQARARGENLMDLLDRRPTQSRNEWRA